MPFGNWEKNRPSCLLHSMRAGGSTIAQYLVGCKDVAPFTVVGFNEAESSNSIANTLTGLERFAPYSIPWFKAESEHIARTLDPSRVYYFDQVMWSTVGYSIYKSFVKQSLRVLAISSFYNLADFKRPSFTPFMNDADNEVLFHVAGPVESHFI